MADQTVLPSAFWYDVGTLISEYSPAQYVRYRYLCRKQLANGRVRSEALTE